MHRYRLSPLILVCVIGGMMLAGEVASASAKTTTRKFFFKQTGQVFANPSGQPLSQNASPAPGDYLFVTGDLYAGNGSHHAKNWTATASLYCTVKSVSSNTDIPSRCEGVVAIGGSMVVSVSTQNLGSSAAGSVYPITGGTGKYVGARGTVKTTAIGNTHNSNFVVTIKT
jgi:hypothetical protein